MKPVNETYLRFFGLERPPFALAPDPDILFPTEDNEKALKGIRACINRGEGYAVLTGNIGTGKTTLCRAVVNHLGSSVETAFIINPFLSESELLQAVLADFGITEEEHAAVYGGSMQRLMNTVSDFLIKTHREGRRCVVIIDECQNLPISTLEQLRILGNLETDREKLLQIVLAGQNELLDLLNSPRMSQLHQRIANWYHLEPIAGEFVEPYFRFRLRRAGMQKELKLTPGAARLVYNLTQGYPRLMNILFDRTLLELCDRRKWGVNEDDVRRASSDLPLERSIPEPFHRFPGKERKPKSLKSIMMIIIMTVIASALIGGWGGVLLYKSYTSSETKTGTMSVPQWTVTIGGFQTKAEAEEAISRARISLGAMTDTPFQTAYVVTLREQDNAERYVAAFGEFNEKDSALWLSEKLRETDFNSRVVEGSDLKKGYFGEN